METIELFFHRVQIVEITRGQLLDQGDSVGVQSRAVIQTFLEILEERGVRVKSDVHLRSIVRIDVDRRERWTIGNLFLPVPSCSGDEEDSRWSRCSVQHWSCAFRRSLESSERDDRIGLEQVEDRRRPDPTGELSPVRFSSTVVSSLWRARRSMESVRRWEMKVGRVVVRSDLVVVELRSISFDIRSIVEEKIQLGWSVRSVGLGEHWHVYRDRDSVERSENVSLGRVSRTVDSVDVVVRWSVRIDDVVVRLLRSTEETRNFDRLEHSDHGVLQLRSDSLDVLPTTKREDEHLRERKDRWPVLWRRSARIEDARSHSVEVSSTRDERNLFPTLLILSIDSKRTNERTTCWRSRGRSLLESISVVRRWNRTNRFDGVVQTNWIVFERVEVDRGEDDTHVQRGICLVRWLRIGRFLHPKISTRLPRTTKTRMFSFAPRDIVLHEQLGDVLGQHALSVDEHSNSPARRERWACKASVARETYVNCFLQELQSHLEFRVGLAESFFHLRDLLTQALQRVIGEMRTEQRRVERRRFERRRRANLFIVRRMDSISWDFSSITCRWWARRSYSRCNDSRSRFSLNGS